LAKEEELLLFAACISFADVAHYFFEKIMMMTLPYTGKIIITYFSRKIVIMQEGSFISSHRCKLDFLFIVVFQLNLK